MSLAKARKAGPPSRARSCAVRTALELLPDDESGELLAMLADPDWDSVAISRALGNEGIKVSGERVRVHRVSECSCS